MSSRRRYLKILGASVAGTTIASGNATAGKENSDHNHHSVGYDVHISDGVSPEETEISFVPHGNAKGVVSQIVANKGRSPRKLVVDNKRIAAGRHVAKVRVGKKSAEVDIPEGGVPDEAAISIRKNINGDIEAGLFYL
jgi:hypothetical protein